MGKTQVPMYCQILGSALHPFWTWFFTFYLELGIKGIGLAGTITNTIVFFLLLFFSYKDEDVRPAC